MTQYCGAYTLMIIAAGAAGLLSGIFYPQSMGIRGMILGAALASGIVLINTLAAGRLKNSKTPRQTTVVIGGAISGLVAGLLVNAYGMGAAERHTDFPPDPATAGWPVVAVSLVFALGLHLAYAHRWAGRTRRGKLMRSLFLAFPAGCVGTLSRLLFESADTTNWPDALIGYGLLSLFSGVPFALLWILAIYLFDPALSFTTWQARRHIAPASQDGNFKKQ